MRQNGLDAARFFSASGVDVFNARMGVRTPEHLSMEHSGKFDIFNVPGLTGNNSNSVFPGREFTDIPIFFLEFHFLLFPATARRASTTW